MNIPDSQQLAINGGDPVRTTPFPERGHVGVEEKAAVDALFDHASASGTAPGYNGDQEMAYCEEFAAYMGGGYADAVSSGTTALYTALRALDLEPFTEVIVGAVTDPGGMMPIPLLNLIPMVADTAPGSYNPGPEQVTALISPRTSAIVIPHIAGEPADSAGIVAIAREKRIPVIEDCSQSHGAKLHGQSIGTFGDLAVFSTMFGKHHNTGGQGGIVFTQDEALYQVVRRASDRGKPFFLPEGTRNVFASLNLNLNEISAAIGREQLRKLPGSIDQRRKVTALLIERIQDLDCVSIPSPLPGAEPSYWFLRIRFEGSSLSCDKETFCTALSAEGLPLGMDYRNAMPHLMPWYVERRVFGSSGYPWTSPDYHGDPNRQFPCPNAHAAMDIHFNLNIHEGWGEPEVDDAVDIFHKVAAAYQIA
ncbi:MAG: DegT/DnrJ/EryC1/StrS family aminotransferase [Anaerolineae bacterium]|nr:DegT/DnrJ/EryC1/StrS family aminotransferase [Anaerolineae bacterium]